MPRRLTILHAIHDFLPRHAAGSEIYAFDLCRELARRHDVTVVCADFDLTRRHGDVNWRVHEGLAVVEIVNNWTDPTFARTYRSPLITNRLEHVLHAIQPDVLHVHSLLNLSFDLPRLARERGIAVVATLHDYTLVCASGGQRIHRADNHRCDDIDPERCARCFPESPLALMWAAGASVEAVPAPVRRLAMAAHRIAPSVMKAVGRLAGHAATGGVTPAEIEERIHEALTRLDDVDVIVAPSASLAAEFVRLGADARRVRVSDYGTSPIPSLVSRGAASQRPASSQVRGSLRFGYVGTLVWHKGVHVAIDAMRALPREGVELQVWGDSSVFADYASGLRPRAAGLPVRFMNRFDRSRIASVYADIDVLVVPSLWLENSPLVIHEAFMAGIPVIGSRIGGIPDLVQDGVSGLLVDPGSAEALASAMRSLLADPALVRDLASRVPAVKSMAQDAAEWEHVYEEVVETRRAPGRPRMECVS